MEIISKNIHMDQMKCKAETQITLEDDINIADIKPDVFQLVMEQGEVVVEEVRPVADHVHVKGKLLFRVFYVSDEDIRRPACMEGSLPFEEQIFMDGVAPGDNVSVRQMLEDLSVGMINSRKLSVQALFSLKLWVETLEDASAAVEIHCEEPIECKRKQLDIASLAIQKKDIFRVRQEMELPMGFPNILQPLWISTSVKDLTFNVMDEKLALQGDLQFFMLYEGEGEDRPVHWYEASVPMNGYVECQGMRAGMVEDIACAVGHKEIEIKADADGEDRKISLECVLDLNLKLYQEEKLEMISDVYGVTKVIEAVRLPGKCKKLLMKNTGRTKLARQLKLSPGMAPIHQICHLDGQIQQGGMEITAEGVMISGVVMVQILYQTGDMEMPWNCLKGLVPFSYLLEIPGIHEGCSCQVEPVLENMSASILGGEEAEVKLTLCFKGLVFEGNVEPMVQEIKMKDHNPAQFSAMPGITAVIVKEGDSLWDIGKKYFVSMAQLKEINELNSEEIKPGDKLLIVKGIS